ncbi:MAG: HYR domain-containing protein [Saprospiraceae bacterium]
MNKLSTQNQNLNISWKSCIKLFIAFLGMQSVLQAQIPVCNPIMNGCLSQGNAVPVTVNLNAACQFTYPDLVTIHAWTAAPVCFDGVNNWIRIGVPFVAQVPPPGTGPVGSGGNSACSNISLPVDIIATYFLAPASTCTILKGDMFNITDIMPPMLVQIATPTLQTNSGCSVTDAVVLAAVKANTIGTDNCTNPLTLNNNITIIGGLPVPPLTCPLNNQIRIVQIQTTDACGNVSPPFPFAFFLQDLTVPTITCPPTQTVFVNGSCVTTHPDYRGLATGMDACGTPLVITQRVIHQPGQPINDFTSLWGCPGCSNQGSCGSTIRLCATDCFGNGGDPPNQLVPANCCSFFVRFVDNTPPTPNPGACPALSTLIADANCNVVIPDRRVPGLFSDNCDPINVGNIIQIPAPNTTVNFTGLCVLAIQGLTFMYTDCNGNGPVTVNCPASFLIIDVTPPTIVCPSPPAVLNLSIDPVTCTYTVVTLPANFFQGIARDNCDPNPIVTNPAGITQFDCNSLGLITVPLTARDCSNNVTNGSCTVLVQVDPNDALWNAPGIVCFSQLPLNLCPFIAVAQGAETCGSWSGDGLVTQFARCSNGPVLFNPTTAGVYSVTYTVGDASCHSEFTRDITVELDPPVTPWFISNISKCLCPGAYIDFETFIKASDSIPEGGVWSIISNLTPPVVMHPGLGSHSATYNGGCGNLVIRYTLTRCNGTTVFQDYTLGIRQCANIEFDIPDDLCQDESFILSPATLAFTASGCADYNFNAVTFNASTGVIITNQNFTVGQINGGTGLALNGSTYPAGNYIFRIVISDPTGVCAPDTAEEIFRIFQAARVPNGINPVGPLCENATFPQTLSIINLLDVNGTNNLTPDNVRWSGAGITDLGVTASFNPPDLDADTRPGPGLFTVCVDLGDARCQDHYCIDILIRDDIPDSSNNLVANQTICATTNIFIPYDVLRAAGGLPGGVFTAIVPTTITGISLPNGFFYTGGCGTISITYNLNNDCAPDNVGNTTLVTISSKPDVEINGAQSVCITDAAYTIGTNIPNGGLLNCPNTTAAPWSIVPNRGLTPGTNSASFNPAVAGEGTFIVQYIYSTAAGCADTSRIAIVVSAASDPTFNVTSPLCQAGPNLTISLLNPNPSVQDGNILNGDNFQEVIWSSSCGACLTTSTPDSTMAVFNPTIAGPGIHLVCVTTGDPSCMKNYCQLIRVVPTTVATLRADTIRGCYLFAEGNPEELDLEQFFVANTTRGGTWTYIAGPGIGILNHTLRAFPGCHQVRYTVTGELPTGACGPMSDDIFIVLKEQPRPYFAIQDQVCWSAGDPPANHIYTPFIQSQNYFATGTLTRRFFISSGTNGSVNANTGVTTITGVGTLTVCMEETLTYGTCGTVPAGAFCRDTFCQQISVSNGTALNASFTVSNDNPCAGQLVNLTAVTPGGQFTGIGVIDGGGNGTGTFTPNGCGTFAVTYTVDDPNGCNAVFTLNITTDRTRPTVTPPADLTVNCDGAGNVAQMTAWAALATATDNCAPGLKLTNRIYDRRSGCGIRAGIYVFEFRAEDSCRNISLAYANFTIQDTTRPAITSPATDLVIECGNLTNTLIISWLNKNGNAIAADVCSGSRLTWSNNYTGNIASYCSAIGEPVTFTVRDECGNSNATTARIIVRDLIAPVWNISPVNIKLECNGAFGRDPYNEVTSWLNRVGDGVAFDSCQISITYTNNFATQPWVGGCNRNTGSKLVTFTASDACNNTSTRQATVSIIDTTRPVITIPAKDTVVDCDGSGNVAALNTWLLNNGGARSFDDCSGSATTPGILRWNTTLMRTLEGCGLTRQLTYMFTSVDSCNNTSLATIARFIVQDTMVPVFVINPADLSVACNKATGTLPELDVWLNTRGGATAVDVCAGGPLRWETDLVKTLDLCSNTAQFTYRFTAFDSCGNSAWREARFNVIDNVAPLIDPLTGYNKTTSCELLNANNIDQLTAWLDSFGGLRATDACSDALNWRHNFSDTRWVYGCGRTRSEAVTFTVTDDCGNSSTRILTISTTDLVKPVFLNCPPPIVQDAEFGHCDAYVTVPKLIATDNCSDPVTITQILGPNPIGFRFPVGTTILKFEARDACNNRDTCSMKVIVNDYWDVPAITCPANVDTTNSTGFCGRNALGGLAPRSVTDVCPHTAVLYVIKNSVGDTIKKGINDASGSDFPKGLNQVCYTVQDQPILLITEVTQQIDAIVVGGTSPLPAFISPADVNGDYLEVTNFGPSSIDLSCMSVQIFQGGVIVGTYTLPIALNGPVLPAGGVLTLHVGPVVAGFPDNPALFFYNMNLPETTIGTPRGYVINHVGLRNIDAVTTNGYSLIAPAQGTPTLTANDWSGVSPTNTSSGSYYRNCIFDFNSPRGWALAEACEPASIGRVNPILVPFVFPSNGRTTSLQTIAPQKATCCFNVNVRDTEVPMCGNARDTFNFNGVTSTATGPSCSVFTILVPASPVVKIGEVWIRNLNLTATNFANTEATLVSPDGTRVRLWDDGTCTGFTNFVAARISDLDNVKVANAVCAVLNSGQNYQPLQPLMAFCNKPAAGLWRLEIENNSPAPSSITLTSWQLTFINSGPGITRDTIISNDPNLCGANFMFNFPTVMDNCCMGTVDVTYTAIPMPGCPLHTVPTGGRVITGGKTTQFFGVGMTQITYLITDMSGNTNSCSFKLTVRDVQPPVILNCPKDYVANLQGGECFKFLEVNPPIDARDNCDSIAISYNPKLGTQLPIGPNKITVTATDKAGNTATCSWTITVIESNPTSRALACNDLINFSLGPDCRGVLTADMILEGIGYGCYDRYLITIEDWITRQNHINLFTVADINRYFKVTITDPISGNKCWGKVLVEYKAIPQINCPSDITVDCNNSLDPAQTGNISITSCILNYTTAWEDSVIQGKYCDTPYVFIVKRTFYVTNELGNTANCTQTIYVRAFDLNRIVWPRHYDNLDLPALNCDEKIDRNKDVTPHMSDYPQCVDGYLLDSAYWLARPNQPDIYPARRIPMILGWNCIDVNGDPNFGHPNPDPVYFPQHRQWTPSNPLCWGPNERVEWRGTGWPTLSDIPIRKDAFNCNLSMKYDDEVFDICANGYEILRHWKVRNMCLPPVAGINPIEFIQVIKVIDQKGPVIAYPDTVVIGTSSYTCTGMWEVPKPWIIDNCSDSVTFTVKTLNGNPIKQNDGSWIIFNMKLGIYNVTITAEDVCGNKTTKVIHANVIDNTPPTVVCRSRTVVSITGNQSPGENLAKLWADALDEGTYDNCQAHVWFKVIRMTELLGTNNGSNANNVGSCNGINGDDNFIVAGNQVYFDDFTYFCCTDAGQKIMVVLRAFDVDPGAGPVTPARMTNANQPLRGHFSDCMVEVEVQNKTIPTVVPPPNIVVSCSFWFDVNKLTDPNDPTFGKVVTDLTARKKVVTQDIVCHKFCERNQRTQYPGYVVTNVIPKPAPNQACDYYNTYFDTAHWDRKYDLVWGFDGYVISGCGTSPTISVNDLRECGQGQIQRVISAIGPNNLNVSAIQTIWVVDCDPFYVDILTCNDARFTDLLWPNGVCTQTPVTVEGCGGDVSPDNPQLGRPQVINNADDNCALISIEYKDEIFTIEPDACFKILRTWTVIDWCQYDPFIDPNFGRWDALQVIKVRDKNKPVVTCQVGPCEPATISTQLGVCVGHITLTAEATDNCSPLDWLLWEYKIDLYNDGKGIHGGYDYRVGSLTRQSFARGDTVEYSHNPFADDRHNPFNADGTYPIGIHRICWFVEDGCGNVGTCCTLFEIKDCKAPTPYCLTGIITVPMPSSGCIDIWAKDLDHGSFDNCTSKDNLKFYFDGDPNKPSIRVCCDDFVANKVNDELIVDVEMWVEDEEGNKDYCRTTIIVQDNLNICPDNNLTGKGKITGNLRNEHDEEASPVNVYLFNNQNMMNQRIGSPYQFGDLALNIDYTIVPERNDDHLNGVSTQDIVLIQKHILGKKQITSPYTLLAADVNNSGGITSADISEIRKLILGTIPEFTKVKSWTFVNNKYVFPDPASPYSAPRNADIKFKQTTTSETIDASFMAIKMGDVSLDASASGVATKVRTSGALNLEIDEEQLVAGQSYSIAFKSSDFENIAGYQFTLRFDPTTLVYEGLESGVLNTDASNFGTMKTAEGILTTSWNSNKGESFSKDDNLFIVKFKALKSGSLRKLFAITNDITSVQAFDANDVVKDIKLNVRTKGGIVETGIFELYQNEPNPVSKLTSIGFRLAEAGPATLTIYEPNGRVLRVYDINGVKGLNKLEIKSQELSTASEILFYQLDADKNSATKKMLIIK